MQSSKLVTSVWFAALLAGCGGGGGDNSASMPISYEFAAPKVNSQRTYTQTIVDNANNSIPETISQTVTTVNSDGSYVLMSEDPTHNTVVVNGTTYAVPTETINVNNSGQDTSYSFTPASGSSVTCTYNPHGNGPDYPLTVGATWSQQYTLTCGTAAAVTYSQSGKVEDVESVTVAGGTFSALKLTSTVTWTDAKGTTTTQTVTNWRDVMTQLPVKRTISVSYSGTLPTTGYPVTTDLELQSAN